MMVTLFWGNNWMTYPVNPIRGHCLIECHCLRFEPCLPSVSLKGHSVVGWTQQMGWLCVCPQTGKFPLQLGSDAEWFFSKEALTSHCPAFSWAILCHFGKQSSSSGGISDYSLACDKICIWAWLIERFTEIMSKGEAIRQMYNDRCWYCGEYWCCCNEWHRSKCCLGEGNQWQSIQLVIKYERYEGWIQLLLHNNNTNKKLLSVESHLDQSTSSLKTCVTTNNLCHHKYIF